MLRPPPLKTASTAEHVHRQTDVARSTALATHCIGEVRASGCALTLLQRLARRMLARGSHRRVDPARPHHPRAVLDVEHQAARTLFLARERRAADGGSACPRRRSQAGKRSG